MSNKKVETEKKIREACNKLVYTWSRSYKKCLAKNKPIPKPLSIPMIAEGAGIAAKTIYVNPEYKSIALTAIAKTTIVEDDLGPLVNKESYSLKEVKELISNTKRENEVYKEQLVNEVIKLSKENEKLKKELDASEEIIKKQIEKIMGLQYENDELKGIKKI